VYAWRDPLRHSCLLSCRSPSPTPRTRARNRRWYSRRRASRTPSMRSRRTGRRRPASARCFPTRRHRRWRGRSSPVRPRIFSSRPISTGWTGRSSTSSFAPPRVKRCSATRWSWSQPPTPRSISRSRPAPIWPARLVPAGSRSARSTRCRPANMPRKRWKNLGCGRAPPTSLRQGATCARRSISSRAGKHASASFTAPTRGRSPKSRWSTPFRNLPILYPAALLAASRSADAAAFLAYLRSPAAVRDFTAQGFVMVNK
jgi:hypothetical protein